MYKAFVRDHKFETVLDHKYFWVKIVNMTVYYIISMKVHNQFSNCI